MSNDARSAAVKSRALNTMCPDAEYAGTFVYNGRQRGIERIRLLGPRAGHEPVRIGIFAGIHGDEPAGTAALRQFLSSLVDDPERATGYELFAYPAVNPVGLERGTRGNCSGLDLNREFWRDSGQPEILIIENELRKHRFNGLIALHADDSCEGTYGYSTRQHDGGQPSEAGPAGGRGGAAEGHSGLDRRIPRARRNHLRMFPRHSRAASRATSETLQFDIRNASHGDA